MAAGIEISRGMPSVEPTMCAPVSFFQKLTLSENCITMGGYGAIAGFLAFLCFWFGITYAGPWLYQEGIRRRWWS